ncbi:MAG: hypothetical protein A2Y23_12170 [Clostridiales bacterium GWB2_37_7]|nr:MAG: hypothetical protein A2Y23_12170 [Clostridiales bacterium GWB2_37_7]
MMECFCKSDTEEFMGWFVQLIAPVLTGAKPAEILSFPNNEKHKARLASIKTCIKLNSKLSFNEFSYCTKCTKLLIYNPNILDETLRDKRNIRFLIEQGYPREYSMDAFIKELMFKMQNGIIPDEIGVFLGYPLKDVMGFIGHASLKLTKVNGWRVYGDPRISDKKYNDFMEAKESIKKMLVHNSPNNILAVV